MSVLTAKEQKYFLGLLGTVPSLTPTPFSNMAKRTIVTDKSIVQFDIKYPKTKFANYTDRGALGVKIKNDDWITISFEPGQLMAMQDISGEDVRKMREGMLEIVTGAGGVTINALAERYAQNINEAISNKKELMWMQLLNDGKVYFDDSGNYIQYPISATGAITYSSTVGIMKGLVQAVRDYKKKFKKAPTDIMVGTAIADAMMADDEQMQRAYWTGQSMTIGIDGDLMVVGKVGNLAVTEFPAAYDQKGTPVFGTTTLKLFDRTQFIEFYSVIDVIPEGQKLPQPFVGKYYADIMVSDEMNAVSTLYAKSNFCPGLIIPESIVTYTVSIS